MHFRLRLPIISSNIADMIIKWLWGLCRSYYMVDDGCLDFAQGRRGLSKERQLWVPIELFAWGAASSKSGLGCSPEGRILISSYGPPASVLRDDFGCSDPKPGSFEAPCAELET
jgi:hypothetical protein